METLNEETFAKNSINDLISITRDSSPPDFCWFGSEFGNKFLVLNGFDPSKAKDDHEKFLFQKFDQEWKNRRPIVIRNLNQNLNRSLWSPQSFMNEFGNEIVDLINCRNQRVVSNVTLKQFWIGFENYDGKQKIYL